MVDDYFAYFAALPAQHMLEVSRGLISTPDRVEFRIAVEAVDALWDTIFDAADDEYEIRR